MAVERGYAININGSYHYVINDNFDVGLEFVGTYSDAGEKNGVDMNNGTTDLYAGPAVNFILPKYNIWMVLVPTFRSIAMPILPPPTRITASISNWVSCGASDCRIESATLAHKAPTLHIAKPGLFLWCAGQGASTWRCTSSTRPSGGSVSSTTAASSRGVVGRKSQAKRWPDEQEPHKRQPCWIRSPISLKSEA